MTQIVAPNLGQSGMAITIETWYKAEGEAVEKGEPLFELSNEKLNQEIESPVSGTLVKILVNEGEKTRPGNVIAEIE